MPSKCQNSITIIAKAIYKLSLQFFIPPGGFWYDAHEMNASWTSLKVRNFRKLTKFSDFVQGLFVVHSDYNFNSQELILIIESENFAAKYIYNYEIP